MWGSIYFKMEREILLKVLNDARKAPSGDNLQNWKVEVMKNWKGFVLRIGSFEEDFFDIKGMASYFSCGCFLKNAEISALKYGYKMNVSICSDEDDFKVARIVFVKAKSGDKLFEEIGKRVTCRTVYDGKDLPVEFYEDVGELRGRYPELESIFIKRGCGFFRRIVDVLYKADVIRMFNKFAASSTSSTVRYSARDVEESKTGLDCRLLGVPIFPKQSVKMTFNHGVLKIFKKIGFKFPSYVAAKRLLDSSPGIGCIFIKDVSPSSAVEAGMFFQELWLILTKYGGCLHPFATLPFFSLKIEHGDVLGFDDTEVLRLKGLKDRLFSVLKIRKSKRLMMVYRYGFAKKHPKLLSLRKGLDDVLIK